MGINLTMKFFIIQFSVAALLMLYSFATPMSEERRAGGGGGGGGGGNELQRAVERQMPEDCGDPIWMDPIWMICAEYRCKVCENGSGCCVYNDDPTNWKYCDRAPDIVPAIGDPTCVNKTIPTVNRRGM